LNRLWWAVVGLSRAAQVWQKFVEHTGQAIETKAKLIALISNKGHGLACIYKRIKKAEVFGKHLEKSILN